MTEDTKPKKTKLEIVEAMKKVYTEIDSLTEDIDELKDEAKAQDFDAPLLARVAKALANSKADDLVDKSQDLIDLVAEVRS